MPPASIKENLEMYNTIVRIYAVLSVLRAQADISKWPRILISTHVHSLILSYKNACNSKTRISRMWFESILY